MPNPDRDLQLQSYGEAANELVSALHEFPREMWHFKPAQERWSIHQILVHLADAEVSAYFRCRIIIAEPGSAVSVWDQDRWATGLRYEEQNVEDALTLFRLLRRMNYELLLTVPETAWSQTMQHPERGAVTLEQFLTTYERHTPKHIEQMRGNLDAWRKAQVRP